MAARQFRAQGVGLPKGPAIVSRIVTPAKLKPIKGRRSGSVHQPRTRREWNRNEARRSSRPKRKQRTSIVGNAADMTAEEHQRRGDAATVLFREVVRRAAEAKKERP
jgi:hypothetical protein